LPQRTHSVKLVHAFLLIAVHAFLVNRYPLRLVCHILHRAF
jgi:hypothetical protein